MIRWFRKTALSLALGFVLAASLNALAPLTASLPSAGLQTSHLSFSQSLAQHVVDSLIAPAQATALSDYAENKLVDWFLRAQTYSPVATVYIGLATTTGSDVACGTEVSGGSYARVAVTSSLANWAGTQSSGSTVASTGTSGTTSNNAAVTFPAPTANWGSVTEFCAWDASTSGNLLFRAALTTAKTVNNGDAAPSFAISALTMQIDN